MLTLDTSALLFTGEKPPLVMARGEGSFLYDTSGKRYLDFVQGWAVNCLGHGSPVVLGALARQAERLVDASPAFHTEPVLELAAELTRATGLDRAFFGSTGAEANEGAIKLARKWGQLRKNGAFEIVTTLGSFHGRTLATMSASGKPGFDAIFPPAMPGFVKVPFGDAAAVKRAIGERTVAVMLEPIQGEAGVVVPPAGYLRELRALTEEAGVLLVLDEVQTGMGRTGTLLACEQEGVRPDILTLGKGLGGGVPLCALLCRAEVSCFAPGDQGGTFSAHPLMAAVGLAVLREIGRPDFLARVRARGERLHAGLLRVGSRYGAVSCRGAGLLRALELPRAEAIEVVAAARSLGLLLNAPRPHALAFHAAARRERRGDRRRARAARRGARAGVCSVAAHGKKTSSARTVK